MASRPHGEALTGSLGAELERALQLSDNAPALARPTKQRPYYSDKPSRQSRENLNGRAYFSGHEGDKAYAIVCRHLAMAWLLQLESTGKPDYRAFESKEAVAHHVQQSMQGAVEALLTRSDDIHLARHADWGRFAAERFQAMEHSGIQATRMLLASGHHMMAAEFKIKRNGGAGEPQYVLKVYDPNVTATHKRLSSNALAHVQTSSLESLLSGKPAFDEYFGAESMLLAVGMPEGGMPQLPALSLINRRLPSELPSLDGSVMYHLLTGGFGGSLRDLKDSLLDMAKRKPEEAFELLCARSGANKHGLGTALSHDRVDGVTAFCEIVNASSLMPEMKAILLAGHTENTDPPALCVGMGVGSVAACKELIGGIVDSGLDASLIAGLLTSPYKRTPALAYAASLGQAETVKVFVDGVSRSGLPVPAQGKLLEARNADGKTALALALEAGHADTARALMQGMAESPALAVKHKQRLFAGKGKDGNPALMAALQHRQPDCVAAFVQSVAKADLPDETKLELLLARQAAGVPGLVMAMANDWADGTEAFVRSVLQSDLPLPVKVKALRAEYEGCSALEIAESHEAANAVAAFQNAMRA